MADSFDVLRNLAANLDHRNARLLEHLRSRDNDLSIKSGGTLAFSRPMIAMAIVQRSAPDGSPHDLNADTPWRLMTNALFSAALVVLPSLVTGRHSPGELEDALVSEHQPIDAKQRLISVSITLRLFGSSLSLIALPHRPLEPLILRMIG